MNAVIIGLLKFSYVWFIYIYHKFVSVSFYIYSYKFVYATLHTIPCMFLCMFEKTIWQIGLKMLFFNLR